MFGVRSSSTFVEKIITLTLQRFIWKCGVFSFVSRFYMTRKLWPLSPYSEFTHTSEKRGVHIHANVSRTFSAAQVAYAFCFSLSFLLDLQIHGSMVNSQYEHAACWYEERDTSNQRTYILLYLSTSFTYCIHWNYFSLFWTWKMK